MAKSAPVSAAPAPAKAAPKAALKTPPKTASKPTAKAKPERPINVAKTVNARHDEMERAQRSAHEAARKDPRMTRGKRAPR